MGERFSWVLMVSLPVTLTCAVFAKEPAVKPPDEPAVQRPADPGPSRGSARSAKAIGTVFSDVCASSSNG